MDPGVKSIRVGEMQVNCYLVYDRQTKDCLVIDPGDDYAKIKAAIDKLGLKPKSVINTHGHIDHISANDYFKLPVYIHKLDKDFLTNPQDNLSAFFSSPYSSKSEIITVQEGQNIKCGGFSLEVIHTPGHTPGSICLKINNILFSGDTLFFQGVGRTDLSYGSEKQLFDSIKNKLFTLNDEVLVYPGHGPSSSIKEEKRNNPFTAHLCKS